MAGGLDPSVIRLIEKIARAKAELEKAKRPHSDRCVVECDPEGYAPCNCGASAVNSAIDRALRELDLGDL